MGRYIRVRAGLYIHSSGDWKIHREYQDWMKQKSWIVYRRDQELDTWHKYAAFRDLAAAKRAVGLLVTGLF